MVLPEKRVRNGEFSAVLQRKTGVLTPKRGQNLLVGVTSWLIGLFGKLFIVNRLPGMEREKMTHGRGGRGGVFNLKTDGIPACIGFSWRCLHDLRMRRLSSIAG
jgi:hypothetical protein